MVPGGTGAGAGRASRALRLLLLLVLALAAVEFLFGSILDASPLRTYLYTPGYNYSTAAAAADARNDDKPFPSKKQDAETDAPPTAHSSPATNTTRDHTAPETTAPPATDPPSVLVRKMIEIVKNSSSEPPRTESALPLCSNMPPYLGPISVNTSQMPLDVVEAQYPRVRWGGVYSPANCTPRHRVAIIVPYRDRAEHLAIFLNHMHPFLIRQRLEYGIYIIEQFGTTDFNRAKLMNVGFRESQRLRRAAGGWQCHVFHDIDLLPLDGRNMYSCPRQPRHMSASIDKLNFQLPYQDIFGGVSAMTLEQFTKVNGFSNKYWGWGGEDDDMFYRLKKMNYHIARYKMSIARYAMLSHKKSSPNPKRYQLLSQTSKTFKKDGLSSLRYDVIKVTMHHLYTHVLVNIDERS